MYNLIMRIPYSIQGVLFGPIFIGLSIFLKALCPSAAGAGCFADHLAVPIFFPLTFIYKVLGELPVQYELWVLLLYWSLVGFLVGFIFDLRTSQSQY